MGAKTLLEVSMVHRRRRVFTEEQKVAAVEHVKQTGKSVHQVAQELDLTETALRRWVAEASRQVVATAGDLSHEEREELKRLRRENQRLQMERDVLKNYHVLSGLLFARSSL